VITGTGAITQAGTGTTTLTGNSSGFAGSTAVNAGVLRVGVNQPTTSSAQLGGPVTVASGATLGGSGTIGGNVTVNSGGILSPGVGGAPSVLTINGNLAVNGGVLDWQLGQADANNAKSGSGFNTGGGTLNDLLNVTGDVTLVGTLNVSVPALTGAEFGPGVYRVINYNGTLTNVGTIATDFTLGTVPSSGTTIQTSVAGQVNLVNTAGLTFRYWDAVGHNNNQVDGGTGVWQAAGSLDNWTIDETGTINAAWTQKAFAVFQATPGTVTVDNVTNGQVYADGMQFDVGGYLITGGGATGIALVQTEGQDAGVTIIRVGDSTAAGAGYTATISAILTGDGTNGSDNVTLSKTDLGTLKLAGNDKFAGLAVDQGVLDITSTNAGANNGLVTLSGNTVSVGTSADVATLSIAGVTNGGLLLANAGTTTITLSAGSSLTGSGNTRNAAPAGFSASGGAIFAAGNLTINGGAGSTVDFSNNTASLTAGAIQAAGDLNITADVINFSGNSALTVSAAAGAGNGGAIYAGTGISITGAVTADNNTAGTNGGVLFANTGNITVDGGDIMMGVTQGNTATTASGGAIYAAAGNVTLAATLGNVDLENNSAGANGGAIFANGGITIGSATNNAATITLTGNQATGGGGAIYSNADAVSLTGSLITLTNNSAGARGGAIRALTDITITGPVIADGNRAGIGASPASTNGGVLSANTGNVTIDGGDILMGLTKANTAVGSGGAISAEAGNVTLAQTSGNVDLENNRAGGIGGAIYAGGNVAIGSASGTTVLSNNAALGLLAVPSLGGAVYAGGNVTINNTSGISGNFTGTAGSPAGINVGGNGGAIYAGGSLSLSSAAGGATISDNVAGFNNNNGALGGAFYVNRDLTLTASGGDITFIDNMQTPNVGGGDVIFANGYANAIYLNNAGGNGSATLNTAGNTISFYDPIASNAANGLVTVTANGGGEVVFDISSTADAKFIINDGKSQMYGNTTVNDSTTFTVQNNAVYGALASDVSGASKTSFAVNGGGLLAVTGPGLSSLSEVRADTVLIGSATATASTGTLTGNGIVSGDVTIGNGGKLNPGTDVPGMLTINGNLVLTTGAELNYRFGAANANGADNFQSNPSAGTATGGGGTYNDLVTVNGNLTLAGTLNVSVPTLAGADFGPGVYRIINYTGTLTGTASDLALGDMPVDKAYVSVQTAVNHQVNLINTVGLDLGFWDGGSTTGLDGGIGVKDNDHIEGGLGVWQAAGTLRNWTDENGHLNGAYQQGVYAVFQGVGGIVTVDNGTASGGQVLSGGMNFAVDGYTITGGGLVMNETFASTGITIIRVGNSDPVESAAMTATIASNMDGATNAVGLQKTDLGTLNLAGRDTFASIAVDQGTLNITQATITNALNVTTTSIGQVMTDGDVTVGTATDAATLGIINTLTNGLVFTNTGTSTITLSGGSSLTASGDSIANLGPAGPYPYSP
jgi:fibronectin-binding autotransporter adhesin